MHDKKSKNKKPKALTSRQRVFTKKYSDEQVERLKRLIKNHTQRGRERFFAIKVDGEFCVYKTSEPEYFDDYKEMIDGSTESIEVIMYYGRSNNCNRHIFYLKESPVNGISPTDVDQKIKDALQRKDQEHLIDNLEQEIDRLTEQIEKLEDELEELRPKANLQGLIKDGISIWSTMGSKNTPVPLAGAEDQPQVEVEIEAEEDTNEEKETEKRFNAFYKRFGDKGLNNMISFMQRMAESKEFQNSVNELIAKENQKEKE